MITKEEAEKIGFVKNEKGFFPTSHSFIDGDFHIYMSDGAMRLCEWERDEDIDISHLDAEQVKTLISLLTKPK